MLKIIYGEAAILIISHHVFAKEKCRNAQVLLTEYSIHTSKPLRLRSFLSRKITQSNSLLCLLFVPNLLSSRMLWCCWSLGRKEKTFSYNFNERVARILVIDSKQFCFPTFHLNGHTLWSRHSLMLFSITTNSISFRYSSVRKSSLTLVRE